jgi:hypothetical protein
MADLAAQAERMAQQQAAIFSQLNESAVFIILHGVDASTMSAEQKRLAEAMVLKVAQLLGTQSHNVVKEALDSEAESEGYSDRLSTFLRLIRQVLGDREAKSLAENLPLEDVKCSFQPLTDRIMAIGRAQVSEIYIRPESSPGSFPAERRSSQLFSPAAASPDPQDIAVAPTRQIALHVKSFAEEHHLSQLTPISISIWLKYVEKYRRENHIVEIALNTIIDKAIIDEMIERLNQRHPIVPGGKLVAAMTKANFYQHHTGPSSSWPMATIAQRNEHFRKIVIPAVLHPRSAQSFATMTQQVLDELYLKLAPTDLESYPSDGALAANYLVLTEFIELLLDVLEYCTGGNLSALSEQGSLEQVNVQIGQLYYHRRHDAARSFPAPKVSGRDQGNDHTGKPRVHEGLVKMIKDKVIFDSKPQFTTHSREIEGIMVVAYDSENLAHPSTSFDNLVRYKSFLSNCLLRFAEQRSTYMDRVSVTEIRLAKTIDKPTASLIIGRSKLYAPQVSTFKVNSGPRPPSPSPAYPSRFAKAPATPNASPFRPRWSPPAPAQGSAPPVQRAGLFALTEQEEDQPGLVSDSESEGDDEQDQGELDDDPYGDYAQQQADASHFGSVQEDDKDENPLLSPYCFLSADESSTKLAAMATRSGAPRQSYDSAGQVAQDARNQAYGGGRHIADPRQSGPRRIDVQQHTRGTMSAEEAALLFCAWQGHVPSQ